MSGSLPVGWITASLGDVCEERVPQGPPMEHPVPYIDIGSIDRSEKRIGETALVTGSDAPTRARQWVRSGDVLVSMTRPNLNAVAQVGAEFEGAVASTGFDVLRSAGVSPGWIFYRVRTSEFVAAMSEDLQGVVYPAVRPRDIRRHELPLPPLPEQHRIVDALESCFTRLDDAVATLEQVQRNLKRYRASVLMAAVEGRLVPTEAELARAEGRDYDPASVLLERILAERRRRWEEAELAKLEAKGKVPKDGKWKAKYPEPVAPDPSELPELPEGWCWATVDQVLENHDQNRVPVKRADRAQRRGRYPYYGASGVIDSINDFLFDGSFLLVGEDGANLLARSTPIAFQAHGRFWVNNHAHVLRTHLNLPLGFLEAFFNATDLARYVTGTAQPKLPQAAMNKIPVPLCPAPEQFRIAEAVERQLSVADGIEGTLDIGIKRIHRLRQSILKWAFEGRLVDQDPSDEPASVLLERIRAERLSSESTRPTTRRRKPKAPNP